MLPALAVAAGFAVRPDHRQASGFLQALRNAGDTADHVRAASGIPEIVPVDFHGWPTVAALVMREDHVARQAMTRRSHRGNQPWALSLSPDRAACGAPDGRQLGLNDAPCEWIVTAVFPLLSITIAEISFRWPEEYFLAWKNSRPSRPALRPNSHEMHGARTLLRGRRLPSYLTVSTSRPLVTATPSGRTAPRSVTATPSPVSS